MPRLGNTASPKEPGLVCRSPPIGGLPQPALRDSRSKTQQQCDVDRYQNPEHSHDGDADNRYRTHDNFHHGNHPSAQANWLISYHGTHASSLYR
jgi:hypothetical protein